MEERSPLDQLAVFKPIYPQHMVEGMLRAYQTNPKTFQDELIYQMEDHAAHYGLEFQRGPLSGEEDFELLRGIKGLGEGFLSGFSTFNVGEPSANEYERIMRSVGELAGFVGYVPSAPFKLMRAHKLAEAAKMLKGRSVPMVAATAATKVAKGIATEVSKAAITSRSAATQRVFKFLNKDVPSHIAEGAFHLGTASAVGAWQYGIDEMLSAGAHGAVTGGVFRGIANLINTGGIPKLDEKTGKYILNMEQKQDKVLRAASASLYEGLRSTFRGETTPEQVYSYLLGAYFGAHETTAVQMARNRFVAKTVEHATKHPHTLRVLDAEGKPKDVKLPNYDPKQVPGYEELSTDVKKAVNEDIVTRFGKYAETETMAAELLESLGMEDLEFDAIKEVIPGAKEITDKEGRTKIEITPDPDAPIAFGALSGEKGTATYIASVMEQAGVLPIHYLGPKEKTSAKGQKYELSNVKLGEANAQLKKASDRVGINLSKNRYASDQARKAYIQIKNADAVYVVGKKLYFKNSLITDKLNPRYLSSEGWAAEMAKDMGKKLHVFDQTTKQWYTWDGKKRYHPSKKGVKLAKNFAVLGPASTKALENPAKKALRELIAQATGLKQEELKPTVEEKVEEKPLEKRPVEEGDALEGLPGAAPIEVEGEAMEGLPGGKTTKSKAPEDAPIDPSTDPDIPAPSHIEPKAVNFARYHLRSLWDTMPPAQQDAKIRDLAIKIDADLTKHTHKGKHPDSEAAIKAIEKTSGLSIDQEGRDDIRNYLIRRNLSAPVQHYSLHYQFAGKGDPGKWALKRLDISNPENAAGNSKRQREPLKAFDYAFADALKREGGKSVGANYIIIDHVIDTSGPFPRERSIREFMGKQDRQKLKRAMSITSKQMQDKGYYYFGGKADAERQYWVRLHPGIKYDKTMRKQIQRFLDIMPGGKTKATKYYLQAKKDYVNKVGLQFPKKVGGLGVKEAAELFDKAYLSNIYWDMEMGGLSKEPTGELTDHMVKVAKSQFNNTAIKNAVAFNKRQQIWFTDGYQMDPKFIKDRVLQKGKSYSKEERAALTDGKFRYILFRDADPSEVTRKTLASEMTEATDGAILVRDDMINVINEAFGLPQSAQNKSFIVSPSADNGVFLGKMMFHGASKEASDFMRKKGVQFVVPESAAKDSGTRNIYDMIVPKSGNATFKLNGKNIANPDVYTWDMEHIKGNLTEKQTRHMLEPQRIPKQLMTNLTRWAKANIPQDVIDDMFEHTIGDKFKGEADWNKKLDTIIKEGDMTPEKINELIENIDKIGVYELIEAMKEPGLETFTGQAYKKILKVNAEAMDDLVESGEMSGKERAKELEIAQEFNSSLDRLLRSTDRLPIYLHSSVRNFVMQAMRNFVVHQVTRPRMPDSISTRMRPYDPWIAHKFPEMNKKGGEKLFYLDNKFREVRLEKGSKFSKHRTLGKLWDVYEKGGKKDKEIMEYLNAVAVRVPMDSLSGAQVLELAGFTGIDGHGAIFHPKVMQLLGGADLDGDKAFAFFGWKKSWRDAYASNAEEFIDKNGKFKDNKDDFRQLLTQQESRPGEMDYLKSFAGKYSSFHRDFMSKGAMQGRFQLGPSVVNRQTMLSAHAALKESAIMRYIKKDGSTISVDAWNNLPARQKKAFRADKREEIKFRYKNKTYSAFISPKADKDLAYARDLLRATIAFPSDPLDEIGLSDGNTFFRAAFESLFNIEMGKGVPKKAEISSNALRGGTYGKMHGFNSAYFGRNWNAGRRYYYNEIADLAGKIHGLGPKQRNTILPKMTEILEPLDWSDDPFQRIDPVKLEAKYTDFHAHLREINKLKKLLGRNTFKALESEESKRIRNPKLKFWNSMQRKNIARSYTKWKKFYADFPRYENLMLKEGNVNVNFIERGDPKKYNDASEFRLDMLERFYKKGTDFFINDLMDMASAKMILKAGHESLTPEFVQAAAKMNRKVKAQEKKLLDAAKDYKEKGGTISTWELRQDINSYIRDFKYNFGKEKRRLTPEEDYFFDSLLISTYGNERRTQLPEALKQLKKWTPLALDAAHQAEMDMAGTNQSRTALNSKYVSDRAIRDFMNTYADQFDATFDTHKPERLSKLKEESKKKVDRKEEKDNPDIFEDDLEGVRGLRKSTKLTHAQHELVDELVGHIKYYHNAVGRDINLVMRGIVGKNIDAMTTEDYRQANRFFTDLRSGTWYMSNIKKIAEGIPILSKRHWSMFPRAVSEEIKAKDFELFEKEGFFQNYKGEKVRGNVKIPTTHLEQLQYWAGKSSDFATKEDEEAKNKVRLKLDDATGYRSIPEGEPLHEIAIAIRHERIAEGKDYFKNEDNKMKSFYLDGYRKEIQATKDKYNWNSMRNQKFTVKTGEGTEQLTGREMVDRINEVYNEAAVDAYKMIKGSNWFYNKSTRDWERTGKDPMDRYFKGWHDPKTKEQPRIDVELFVKDFKEKYKSGEKITMDLGLENLRKIARSLMLQNPAITKDAYKLLVRNKIDEVGFYHPEDYWPHMMIDKVAAAKSVERALEYVEKMKAPIEWKKNEVRKLVLQHRRLTGEWDIADMTDWNMFDGVLEEIAAKKKGEHMNWFEANPTAQAMGNRSSHIPGWAKDAGIWEMYQKNLIDTYYRSINMILSRHAIDDFHREKYKPWGEDITRAWGNFFKSYVNDAMGNPAIVPESWISGDQAELMNVKGTPYAWWADNRVTNRLNHIKKKLGFAPNTKLPEELQGINVEDIRHWSNLEAKYEMAALLAHPKSAMANIYGGTLHTVQSVGWRNWRNSRSIDFLRTHINPKWKDMKDVNDWVVGHGVLPDFILYEAGLSDTFKKGNYKSFLGDALKVIKNDPMVKDETLRSLAKKHKITDQAFDKAAWFMRTPERQLRRDAFVSHYIQAKELYGHSDMSLNHPFLIDIAKKGVQSTQFLYSAPYRPAFARTALGKVMTRFQLWAWNAVRFRKDVINQAHQYGWQEGTPEFDRFRRMMTTDMFVIAMGNVFAYSLFESALPAPYSWLQDTADWIFGNEKERDKAFFGSWPTSVAPLQMVTPPIARLLPASFRAIADDDWSKVSGYYIWTMFPFGRLARDVKGIVQNPMRTVEKMTGIPYAQFASEATKYRNEDEE